MLLFILLSWVFFKLPNGQGEDTNKNRSLRRSWQTRPFALEGQGPRHQPGFGCGRCPHEAPQEPQSQRGSQGTGVSTPTPTSTPCRTGVRRFRVTLPSRKATPSCL